ncbi:hypothetical protein cyc_03026 [Cyclospora cayetanensis]|uniref:Uncharacterized protein n=1 Tax=Cyclospora cayetanensis TaxID=88456 RepID=A0A1D3CX01_9EIME|nr:hypothetical protein cyc_03026 [Cyclospora cayetanensis]
MRKLTKILIGVGIAVLLIAVLILTLVIVLRKEEWIVLEKSFSSLGDSCSADWSGNSDWRRTRCKMPLICSTAKDQRTVVPSGYCRLPWSEGEGKSCAASVHLCSTGLSCDPYLKICRRLITVGGSCTEQNAFLCESGICGYAATQTVDGEPLGGRHSLSRYCIVKDLPPGASCDRFRHCVSGCLQCVQGVCKPVMSPLDHQHLLLEQQKELLMPLAVNGFSADQEQQPQPTNTEPTRTSRLLKQEYESWKDSSGETMNKRIQKRPLGHQNSSQNEQESLLDEQAIRRAWEQRAAEVSAILGETVTPQELAEFFTTPRDMYGQALGAIEGERGSSEGEETIAGQQAPWGSDMSQQYLHTLQQPQPSLATSSQSRPLLNGSLAKRLARLFTGVSYAFTPEDQESSLPSTFGAFPPSLPPQLPGTAGMASMGTNLPQQNIYGSPNYDIEAMEASGSSGVSAASLEQSQGDTASDEEGGELEGLFFPGIISTAVNPVSPLGVPVRRPMGPLPPLNPPFNMQRPPIPTRLPPVVPPLPSHFPTASQPTFPPLGNMPMVTPSIGGPLPSPPLNTGLHTPLTPHPAVSPPVATLPGLPNRRPPEYKGGCWLDRCCATHHYCSFLHASQGCQPRKREGAACVGDSARECEDRLSCVNGECSPWFSSRHASAGDPIVLTDNVDIDSVCAPWQRFEYGHSAHSSHLQGGMPPQLALPSPLETPNPYGNNLGRDIVRTFRKFTGRCTVLDKKNCVTDRECWGVGGFGFCDVRSKKCRSPSYPACISILKDLYACLWHEGRLRETTDEYIVSHMPRTPQFLLHELPISVNHVQSKCIPSAVLNKRAEFLKCVHAQGFTLERIVYIPEEWSQG